MNETISNLVSRRSVKKYTDKQIKKEDLEEILKAGEFSPCGMGKQSPIMVVIQNRELINKIGKINAKIMGANMDPFYGAPTLIIVFADKTINTYL